MLCVTFIWAVVFDFDFKSRPPEAGSLKPGSWELLGTVHLHAGCGSARAWVWVYGVALIGCLVLDVVCYLKSPAETGLGGVKVNSERAGPAVRTP